MMDNGGPAFPNKVVLPRGTESGTDGMSLRDWFAGQAMPSIATHCIGINTDILVQSMKLYKCDTVEEFAAKLSYMYADAMLEVRKQ